MTFNFAPWAIDGARSTSALARSAVYASGGIRSGITKPSDLRVLPLEVPGNGLRITRGNATVLNWYQSDPSETYTVSNPALHVVPSADMPPAVAMTAYYLVCVVVGDPEFNQTGHPYMPGTPIPAELQADYEYVRIVVIPCASDATRFEDLGAAYPGYAMARLEIPPSTTTITGAMITDLRSMSQARTERVISMGQPSAASVAMETDVWKPLGDFQPFVQVPEWATHVDIIASVNGLTHVDPELFGQLRVDLGLDQSPFVYFEFEDTDRPAGERVNVGVGYGAARVDLVANTSQQLKLQVNRISGAGSLQIYAGTTVIFDVFFSEKPIL